MPEDAKALANCYKDYFAPQLRDMLPAIIAQLLIQGKQSFLSALRVCRNRAAFGIRLQWRRASQVLLAYVADISRRQSYADCIGEFEVWGNSYMPNEAANPPGGTVLKDLSFPCLCSLYVSSERGELGADRIAPLLQPQLEELSCCPRLIADPAVR